jgi:hypothetical protein
MVCLIVGLARRNNETREKVLAISLWGTNNNEEETNVMKMSICDNCEKGECHSQADHVKK